MERKLMTATSRPIFNLLTVLSKEPIDVHDFQDLGILRPSGSTK